MTTLKKIGTLLAIIVGCTLAGAGIGAFLAHMQKADYERNK